jgi:SWI/SNF-related matrix-associated actin-dependent regulator of chromatin subfamily A containing DEAD/H box 1
MLLTTRAGGVGINATAASVVVFLDVDWNAHAMRQAEDRVHRIGQTRPVEVRRLLAAGTVEVRMVEVSDGKGALSDALLAATESRQAPVPRRL